MRQRRAGAVALALACLAGCGSSTKASDPPSTAAPSPSAARYLADVAPFNAAAAALPSHARVTSPSMVAFARAGTTFARKLLAQPWPAGDESDVRTLAAAVNRLSADITARDTGALVHAAASADAEAQVLRRKLGLPPDKS